MNVRANLRSNRAELIKAAVIAILAGLLSGFVLPFTGAVVVAALAGTAWAFRPGLRRWLEGRRYAFRARDTRDIVNAPAPASARPAPAPQQPQRPAPAGPAPRRVPQPPPPPGKRAAARRGASAAAAQPGAVPPIWLALADSIREFVPEDHIEHLGFFSGTIAGILAVADAFRDNADMQFNHLGLDPAAANATLEFADAFADTAESCGLTREQFLVIYDEVLKAIENGLVLPHSGRWLTGEAA